MQLKTAHAKWPTGIGAMVSKKNFFVLEERLRFRENEGFGWRQLGWPCAPKKWLAKSLPLRPLVPLGPAFWAILCAIMTANFLGFVKLLMLTLLA